MWSFKSSVLMVVSALVFTLTGGSSNLDGNAKNAPKAATTQALEDDEFLRQRQTWDFWRTRLGVPYFSNTTATTVITSVGQTTYLHCLVGNLGDRQVSWMRVRDLRILSIGQLRYTPDTRFTPLHEDGNDVWALKVTQPRQSDSGNYECQVSHHDDMEKKMKKPVLLIVLDSVAVIGGSLERHVKEGSTLQLSCRVEKSSGPPSFVFWYKDNNVVNYADRPEVIIDTASPESIDKDDLISSMELLPQGMATAWAGQGKRQTSTIRKRTLHVSTLEIRNVTNSDAGLYTCAPSNAKNHSVVVHVLKGENLAMQRKNDGSGSSMAAATGSSAASSSSSSSSMPKPGLVILWIILTFQVV